MIETLLHKIGHVIVTVAIAVGSLFGVHNVVQSPVVQPQTQNQNVGAAIPVVVATFQTSLQAGILSSDTSMTLVNGADTAGHNLSGYICFNIDEGTALEEFVCGTASGTSITSMIRGIDPINGATEVTALKKRHGRGATVKITNYPSLGIVSRILNGNETIPNPISYTAGVGPVSGSDLTDKEYVLSVVNGGPVTYNQVIVAGTAGETFSTGALVYLKVSDGRWYKTTASTSSTLITVQLGIAQSAGSAGVAVTSGILIRGVDTNNTGTAGALAYAANTAGTIAATTGTTEKVVGQYMVSSGGLYFDPAFYYGVTADQKAALAGNGGTPSSVNTYITQTGITALGYATSANVQTFLSNGTWTKPSGAKAVIVIAVGAGGGGQGGSSGVTVSSSGGGGGGAASVQSFDASLLGATESVSVGIGGTGGAGGSGGGAGGGGVGGNSGGNSSFGTNLRVLAKGGTGGSNAATSSAGGGVGPFSSTSGNQVGGIGSYSGNTEWGGSYGGNVANGTSTGGSSIYAAGGGGRGIGQAGSGSDGGTVGSYSTGGGALGGTAGNPGTAGATNTTLGIGYGGSGGGGGGGLTGSANASATGGVGGFPGGGGGGGGGSTTTNTGSVGGAGANGKVTVITYF